MASLELRQKIVWVKLIVSMLIVFFTYFISTLAVIINVSVRNATTNMPIPITSLWITLIGITFLWSFIAIGVSAYFIRIMAVVKTEEITIKL